MLEGLLAVAVRIVPAAVGIVFGAVAMVPVSVAARTVLPNEKGPAIAAPTFGYHESDYRSYWDRSLDRAFLARDGRTAHCCDPPSIRGNGRSGKHQVLSFLGQDASHS